MEQKPDHQLMHRTNMYFTAPQMEKLSSLSSSTGLSAAEIVRRAVDEYFIRQSRSAAKKAAKGNQPESQALPEA